jgi:hypothetical protein
MPPEPKLASLARGPAVRARGPLATVDVGARAHPVWWKVMSCSASAIRPRSFLDSKDHLLTRGAAATS